MISKGLIKIIRLYQRAPMGTHRQCKFIPSCSEYAIQALENYGLFYGSFLALKRILKCNPWSKGGLDPLKSKK